MDGPKIRVKLTVKCKDLVADNAEKVYHPIVIVKSKQTKDGEYEEIGRTEIIGKTVEKEDVVEFMTKTIVDYHFEAKTYLQINLLQHPGGKTSEEPKPVSWLECTVGQVVSARGKQYEKPLAGRIEGGVYGSMIVFAEEIKGRENESIQLTLKGANILNKDGVMNKSDPFVIMKRTREDGTVEELHKTEYIKNTETPEWEMFEEPLLKLCNGDLRAKIRIEVWDYDKMSKNDEIGYVETCVQELLEVDKLQLIDYKEGRSLDPGQLVIAKAELLPRVRTPTFLDYVQGGMEITLSVAVDFTASNAAAKNPRSLHYIKGEGSNDYQKALTSVGEVLIEYDSDKKVEALGFGGSPYGTRLCSHCFALAGPEQFEVEGMAGLMTAYEAAVNSTRMSGPTNFHQVIEKAEAKARAQGDENYHVLLIITDGAISDKTETAKAIVKASDAPLSIIIVGVGKADFGKMQKLDGDDAALKDNKGNSAERDIVQFVPLREFEGNALELSKAVLKELPDQVLAHKCKKKIKPKRWDFELPDKDWFAESGSRELSLGPDPLGILGFLNAEPNPEEEAMEEEEEE